MKKRHALPSATVRAALPHDQAQGVAIRFLGYANHATWEEHMEWATRGLPEAEKAAEYEKYRAMRAETEARDVTPKQA